MRSALIVLALVACGSKKPPPAHEDHDEKPLYDDESRADVEAQPIPKQPPPRVCPASYAAATGTCEAEWPCSYPEGTCVCAGPSHCPGPSLRGPSGPLTWQCEPPPPETRADGCPGKQPVGNKPCKDEGKECRYDHCCVHFVTCDHGEWQETRHECPP